jgi:hypothetical protein
MSADRRRRLLVNGDELRTDRALREAATEAGYRIDAKVRVADVLDIRSSGLSSAAYGYAFRSHFDWVVSDLDTTKAVFAVEFDGASHSSDAARANDALKDGICRDLEFPLLRIDGLMLRPFRRRTVLAVLMESWGLYKAFTDAQEAGTIPWDEIFDAHMSLERHIEDGRLVIEQPYNLARPAADLLHRLLKRGQVIAWRFAIHRVDRSHEAFSWAYLPDGRVVVGQATVRSSNFPAFPSFDLPDDLAHMCLADRLQRYLEGYEGVAEPVEALAQRVPGVLADRESTVPLTDADEWSFGGRGAMRN